VSDGRLAHVDLPETAREVIPGLWEWDNLRNKFHVLRLHYLADPEKRTPEWKARALQGLDRRGWEREYEISFATGAGEPVFPEFDAAQMVRPFHILPQARWVVGWDFGQFCPAAVLGQLDAYGRLLIHAEVVLRNVVLESFIGAVDATLFELLGTPGPYRTFDAGDPSAEKLTDLGMVRQIMQQHGKQLYTRPAVHTAENNREARSYTMARQRLMRRVMVPQEGQSPALLIHPRCVTLIQALQGAFHFGSKPPFRPVDEHPFKDIVDAWRYLNENLEGAVSPNSQAAFHRAAVRDIRPLRRSA
jgi:hypothetical protein